MRVRVFADGACRGNPGPGACGAVLYVDDREIRTGKFLGVCTNNRAEYHAALEGLRLALTLGPHVHVDLLMDSMLVIRQLLGEYRVKDAHLQQLHREALLLLRQFDGYTLTHIPREQNTAADKEANRQLNLGSG